MNVGLYQSAASLSALERWQEAVSQNITSSEVTAYKKRTVSFSGQDSGEFLTDPKSRAGRGQGQSAVFPVASSSINFLPGETKPTGRKLDVALQGEGFFEVQMPDGTRAYTRTGEFQLRADRSVVTGQGASVLLASGSPLQLNSGQGELLIKPDGSVSQGSTSLGKLSIQTFEKPGQLLPLAAGLFSAPPDMAPTPVASPAVLQGNLESSNLTSLHEMVDLVTISRAYEANQKIITSSDDLLDKTIQAFG
jgi:flagellar basal body rod protein FlgG